MRKTKVRELKKVMEYYGQEGNKSLLRKLKRTYNEGNYKSGKVKK